MVRFLLNEKFINMILKYLFYYLVPHLSITRHSLANRYSEQAILQKALLKRESTIDTFGLNSSSIILEETKPSRISGAEKEIRS
jgi:hypothetical protein